MVALKCPKDIEVLVLPKSAWGVGESDDDDEEEEEEGGVW